MATDKTKGHDLVLTINGKEIGTASGFTIKQVFCFQVLITESGTVVCDGQPTESVYVNPSADGLWIDVLEGNGKLFACNSYHYSLDEALQKAVAASGVDVTKVTYLKA